MTCFQCENGPPFFLRQGERKAALQTARGKMAREDNLYLCGKNRSNGQARKTGRETS